MPVCSFCKRRFKEPRGLTVFTFDGRSVFFCSSKCRKNNDNLKRDPKKVNWVIKRKGYLLEKDDDRPDTNNEKADNGEKTSKK
jgi:ribosomal protein L24E